MADETTTRVISTPDLIAMWRKAGPGKRPARQFINSLDPDGLHTLSVLLPFHNDNLEHRLRGLAKMPDTDEPIAFEIDMLVADFERLLTVAEFLTKVKES